MPTKCPTCGEPATTVDLKAARLIQTNLNGIVPGSLDPHSDDRFVFQPCGHTLTEAEFNAIRA